MANVNGMMRVMCLSAALACCCLVSEKERMEGDGTDESPLVSAHVMSGYGLVLPFPVSERHTVTQGNYGTVSHTAESGTPLAVDFSGRSGSPVLAPFDGTVRLEPLGDSSCPAVSGMPARGANRGFGNHLYIETYGNCRVHLAHLSSLSVTANQRVRQGEVVGHEGSSGCATGPNIHIDCSCREPGGDWRSVLCEPMSDYRGFAIGQVFGTDEFVSLPVGTTVQAYGRPEIYLVCEEGTLCHIADWEAYRARRFFYDSDYPTAEVVRLSESALECYRSGPEISGPSDRYLVECLSGLYLVVREGGQSFRRWVPFDFDGQALESELLLKSWGLRFDVDYRGLSPRDCILPEGERLVLRDGTVIEMPDDNDFYVVTGDRYESETPSSTASHGYVMRLRRSVGGRPFMPLLYGSYGRVLQVPSDAIFTLTNGMRHGQNEFTPDLARHCEGESGSGGAGVGDCGDGNCDVGESCRDCPDDCCVGADECVQGSRRCIADVSSYEVCVHDYDVGTNAWALQSCPSGTACAGGECRTISEPDPDPESDPLTGRDPPHTIRCDLGSDRLSIRITGPILDALIAVPAEPSAIQYGSDTDGWVVPYPAGSRKQSVPWAGDSAVYLFDLPRRTDGLGFYVVDARSSSRHSWFDTDLLMDGFIPWRPSGDCRLDGTLLRIGEGYGGPDPSPPEPESEPEPDPDPYCGDRSCDPGESCVGCSVDCGPCQFVAVTVTAAWANPVLLVPVIAAHVHLAAAMVLAERASLVSHALATAASVRPPNPSLSQNRNRNQIQNPDRNQISISFPVGDGPVRWS